jgi:hypothetical protein
MNIEEQWKNLKKQIEEEAIDTFREKLSRELLIGPCDRSCPESSHYSIFIGEYQIGRWPSRIVACNVADKLSEAIRKHLIPYKR